METNRIKNRRARGWIGVDLDGTLAHYSGYKGPEHIGEPVPAMLLRVRSWIIEGQYDVKIFTARAEDPVSVVAIEAWLQKHELPALEITNKKDFLCVQIWDDRAVQVIPNTGNPVAPL